MLDAYEHAERIQATTKQQQQQQQQPNSTQERHYGAA
jgi:hypothetical protein